MKKVLIFIYILFSVTFLFYVSIKSPDFPAPPPSAVQSKEPADTETPLRRAYFTDYTRAEVISWYRKQFKWGYLLNYPPENSQSIIRDQTRSTFLQEIVHPFRETLFINGYEPAPTDDKDRIVIDGVHYRQKIIIKYVPSNVFVRFLISLLSLIFIPILYNEYISKKY